MNYRLLTFCILVFVALPLSAQQPDTTKPMQADTMNVAGRAICGNEETHVLQIRATTADGATRLSVCGGAELKLNLAERAHRTLCFIVVHAHSHPDE